MENAYNPKLFQTISIMVNKPKGFTCSNEDAHAERLVFELLGTKYRKFRLFCAGRLDVDSEGLVILTNDGSLATVSHILLRTYVRNIKLN